VRANRFSMGESQSYVEENLIVLYYNGNNCVTSMGSLTAFRNKGKTIWLDPGKLEVDLEEGAWSFDSRGESIGRGKHMEDYMREGVVGVYDRTNLKHLAQFMRDSQEAVKTRARGWMLED